MYPLFESLLKKKKDDSFCAWHLTRGQCSIQTRFYCQFFVLLTGRATQRDVQLGKTKKEPSRHSILGSVPTSLRLPVLSIMTYIELCLLSSSTSFSVRCHGIYGLSVTSYIRRLCSFSEKGASSMAQCFVFTSWDSGSHTAVFLSAQIPV